MKCGDRGREWTAGLGAAEFAPDCAECGNTVDEDGEQRTLDGVRFYFHCGSCTVPVFGEYVFRSLCVSLLDC